MITAAELNGITKRQSTSYNSRGPMPKTLVIENDFADYCEPLKDFLAENFLEDREVWDNFRIAMWPENREASMGRLMSLKSGDNLVMHHVFHGFGQLEMMLSILEALKKKKVSLNIHMLSYGLDENLARYFYEYESQSCPNTPHYRNSVERREKFKSKMNKKLIDALAYHKVFNSSLWQVQKPQRMTMKKVAAYYKKRYDHEIGHTDEDREAMKPWMT